MGANHNKESKDPNVITYLIDVYTGKRKWAGTTSDVYIKLRGTKGVSPDLVLDNKWKRDFEKGKKNTFRISSPDLGDIWMIDLWKKDKIISDMWYVDKIEIKHSISGEKWFFPVYRWVDEREEIMEGTAVLPQHDTGERLIQRRDELEKKRGLYQYVVQDKLPSYVKVMFKHLPVDERYSHQKVDDMNTALKKVAINFGLEKFLKVFKSWGALDDYLDFFHALPLPSVHHDWTKDETFGRLRLQGVNCLSFYKLKEWPVADFALKEEDIKSLLRPNTTLQLECEAGRLLFIDYSYYEEFNTPEQLKEGKYMCAPKCLLYINEKNMVVPLAIQLQPKPTEDPELNPIFTPLSPATDWLYAKMIFAQADGWDHQFHRHLLATHLVSEPIVLASQRNLPSCHPVWKMLYPHFKYQLAVNCRAREMLIARGGPVDIVNPWKYDTMLAILCRGYSNWNFSSYSFKNHLKERGLSESPTDPPGYFYRDDGIKIWDAMESFVQEVLSNYYKDDEDILNDGELQAWSKEVSEIGFGTSKGFPAKISSVKHLVEVVTTFIYTVSVTHAMLNFTQYDHLAFVPAAPSSLSIIPPGYQGKKWKMGEITEDCIFKALPHKSHTTVQIAMSYVLSSYSDDDVFLGQYPEVLFKEPVFTNALQKYQAALVEIAKEIEARPSKWKYLHPSKVTNSITI